MEVSIKRSLIYSEVEEKRQRQDEKYGGESHDNAHVPNDWVVLVTRYASQAAAYPVCKTSWTAEDSERFRKNMVSVAALAIAAIEYTDRYDRGEG